MSAAIVRVVGEERPGGLPPVVLRKIAAFLSAGNTGTIELNVKAGRVLGMRLIEVERFPARPLDGDGPARQD